MRVTFVLFAHCKSYCVLSWQNVFLEQPTVKAINPDAISSSLTGVYFLTDGRFGYNNWIPTVQDAVRKHHSCAVGKGEKRLGS